ncbi:MAG: enolase [Candidatus Aenigmatarchaeota archaeon]
MIKNVRIEPVLNSRGETTIFAEIITNRGTYSASAPSGKSKGAYEAKAQPFEKIKKLFPAVRKKLVGLDESEFSIIDDTLESIGVDRMGSNLAIALSMAAVRAAGNGEAYAALGGIKSFPYPLGNVVGGGVHGGGLSIQEVLVIPVKAKNVREAIDTNFAIWHAVGNELGAHGITGRNDEGAWVATADEAETLGIVTNAAKKFGAKVGIDVAAGQLYKGGKYYWPSLGRTMSKSEQMDKILDFIKEFRLVYVEDPFTETDWESFAQLMKKTKILVCGDDLFATQPERLDIGVHRKAARAAIIKPDQAGLISKTLRAIHIAKDGGLAHVVSHRSGETCDTFIADLAVATGAPLIKCGISGEERVVKANRLAELWDKVKKPVMTKLRL